MFAVYEVPGAELLVLVKKMSGKCDQIVITDVQMVSRRIQNEDGADCVN